MALTGGHLYEKNPPSLLGTFSADRRKMGTLTYSSTDHGTPHRQYAIEPKAKLRSKG